MISMVKAGSRSSTCQTRKLLLRKYGIILLISGLGYLYLSLIDLVFGYGLNNIPYTMDYLLYTIGEKMTFLLQLSALLIPDILRWVKGAQPSRGAER